MAKPKKGATRAASAAPSREINLAWLKPMSIILLVVSFLVGGGYFIRAALDREISGVEYVASFDYVKKEEVNALIAPYFPSTFFQMDVDAIRQAVEDHALIRKASVVKNWNGPLIIKWQEELPVARWREHDLLSQEGNILPIEINDRDLPLLDGPEDQAKDVMAQFQLFSAWAKQHQFGIRGLQKTSAGWHIDVVQGFEIIIGLDDTLEALKRLDRGLQAVIPNIENVSKIDMRYNQGFAVAWKAPVKHSQG
jgi:cell division protein FtsQ